MGYISEILENGWVDKLNSATKYPSILTYHALGDRGALVEKLTEDMDFVADENYFITEKINGTCTRIISDGDDFILGSREDLLYAKGDRIENPVYGIVSTLKHIASELRNPLDAKLVVLFGEVYGDKSLPESKNYTNNNTHGFRLFDIMTLDSCDFSRSVTDIASWRDKGGQQFATTTEVAQYIEYFPFITTVPYLSIVNGTELSNGRKEMLEYLQKYIVTRAGLGVDGKAEGIVVRNADRSFIRKIRFEDYERTARREQW